MADQFNIGVRFGGNIDELRAASSGAAAALTGIKNAAGSIPPALNQIGPAANKAAAGVERLKIGLADPGGGGFASIGQGAQSAIRSIDSLETEIDQLEAAIRKSTDPAHISRLSKSVADLQRQINNIKVVGFETSIKNITTGSGAAAAALAKIKAPAGAANGALTDFSRVLQDLPFGTVGVINNLTQLPDTLKRVSDAAKATGTSVGSLLLQSVKGFGGIGLAISAITSGILIYQNGITGFFKGAQNGAKEAKEAADEYESSLKSIGGQIAQEATRVSVLVSALKSETLSRKEKVAALEELKRINPEYFGQLQQETGFIKNLTLAYVAYIKSLRDQFAAKALDKQIEKLFDKRLQVEADVNAIQFDPATNQEVGKLEKRIDELQKKVQGKPIDLFNLTPEQKELGELNKQLTQIQQTNFRFETRGAQSQLKQLDEQINQLLLRRQDFGKNLDLNISEPKGADKQDAVLKRLKDELAGLQKQLEVTNRLREAGILPINRENDALELQLAILSKLNQIDAREVAIKAKASLEIDPILNELEIQKALQEGGIRQALDIKIPVQIEPREKIDVAKSIGLDKIPDNAFDAMLDAMRKAGERAKEEARKITIEVGAIMQQFVADAAIGVGESIGNIISGVGDASDIVKGLGSLIGDVIIQLGKFVIQAGIEVLALKKAFENFIISQPALAIAAGIAAVAVGTALKNSFNKQKTPGFADGVTNFSGGFAIVGERGPELVNLPRGSDVIPNHMLGGGQQVFVQVAGVQRGDDLYYINQRVTTRKRRI